MSAFETEELREKLLDQIFAARTLREIEAAKTTLAKWIADHPEETGMRDAYEVLSHREDFAREMVTEKAEVKFG